jgi:hypothetical protein
VARGAAEIQPMSGTAHTGKITLVPNTEARFADRSNEILDSGPYLCRLMLFAHIPGPCAVTLPPPPALAGWTCVPPEQPSAQLGPRSLHYAAMCCHITPPPNTTHLCGCNGDAQAGSPHTAMHQDLVH